MDDTADDFDTPAARLRAPSAVSATLRMAPGCLVRLGAVVKLPASVLPMPRVSEATNVRVRVIALVDCLPIVGAAVSETDRDAPTCRAMLGAAVTAPDRVFCSPLVRTASDVTLLVSAFVACLLSTTAETTASGSRCATDLLTLGAVLTAADLATPIPRDSDGEPVRETLRPTPTDRGRVGVVVAVAERTTPACLVTTGTVTRETVKFIELGAAGRVRTAMVYEIVADGAVPAGWSVPVTFVAHAMMLLETSDV